MALFDPTSGAWFPDVSQAMLGRERQSQATLGQIGQREDVNRQQKIQDDELKKQNKKIRSMTKVLIDSGDIEGVSAMQANTLDIGTLSGLIEGTGLALNRDIQRENIQTSDLNQAAQTAKNELFETQIKRDEDFRQTIGTFARDYAAPLQIPPAVNMQGKAGEVSSAINRINKKLTNPPAGSVTPEDEAHLLQSRDRLQRHQENISKLTTAGSAPALVALGQRQMTEGEKSSPEFINQVNEMLGLRLETRAGEARADDLSESIKLMSGKRRAAAALQSDAPIFGDIIKGNLPVEAVPLLTPPAATTRYPPETYDSFPRFDKDKNIIGYTKIGSRGGITMTGSTTPPQVPAGQRIANARYADTAEGVQEAIHGWNDKKTDLLSLRMPSPQSMSQVFALDNNIYAAEKRKMALNSIPQITDNAVRDRWATVMAKFAPFFEKTWIDERAEGEYTRLKNSTNSLEEATAGILTEPPAPSDRVKDIRGMDDVFSRKPHEITEQGLMKLEELIASQ